MSGPETWPGDESAVIAYLAEDPGGRIFGRGSAYVPDGDAAFLALGYREAPQDAPGPVMRYATFFRAPHLTDAAGSVTFLWEDFATADRVLAQRKTDWDAFVDGYYDEDQAEEWFIPGDVPGEAKGPMSWRDCCAVALTHLSLSLIHI